MDIALIILGILCLIIGLAGCILPMLPGPPVAYVGLILLHLTDGVSLSTTELLVGLLIVVVVQVLDYIIPMLGTKYSGGGGKWANRGTLIGTLLGMFFLPWEGQGEGLLFTSSSRGTSLRPPSHRRW